jgi:hypothetical protein
LKVFFLFVGTNLHHFYQIKKRKTTVIPVVFLSKKW